MKTSGAPARAGKAKDQAGFSLPEALVVLVLMALGTGLFAKGLLQKSVKKADAMALKSLLTMASASAISQSQHFGVHYDSASRTAGLFKDEAQDQAFNGTDTLKAIVKLSRGQSLKIYKSDGTAAKDICFKKNGAVADEASYEIRLKSILGDSTVLQVIAASGRVLGP